MADLAAELGAPGLRVFGDTIQPGADRASTQSWIAESIRKLAESTAAKGVEVWLENHGDFAAADEIAAILLQAASPNGGVVWDPANSFRSHPGTACARCSSDWERRFAMFTSRICSTIKDGWKYVLTGEGIFPLLELKATLEDLQYDRFLSFEWEKKWHPEIADADIALPHFARWFRKNYA